MTSPAKVCNAAQAAALLEALGAEFAIVANPAYIHPPRELYPLAPKAQPPLPRLRGVVCDMDGTTTTTEPLCLHALEWMVRRITGRMDAGQWPGLSHERDYPHIIGNSTTRHIEYLVETYDAAIRPQEYLESLIESIHWTQALGPDPSRREEARTTARLLGIQQILDFPAFRAWLERPHSPKDANASSRELASISHAASEMYCADDVWPAPNNLVRGAIEIYYARYHWILEGLARGEGASLGREVLGGIGGSLIEPMPGAALFLAAIKGLLHGEEAALLYDALAPRLLGVQHGRFGAREVGEAELQHGRGGFVRAAAAFARAPLQVAVVTSSIRYEARIVLGEVFAIIRREIEAWPLSVSRRAELLKAMRSPEDYYDAILTASDSSEIRLKPHRDLYSMALHQLGFAPEEFGAVMGLEDSESGIIALRAAGIGLAIAVPFAQTQGHSLEAAAKINHGGLPELMLRDGFCLA